MDALRARFSAVGAAACTFFHAWISCFVLAAVVNPEAAGTVEGLQPHWDVYADQINEEKADRASRVPPPRVPLSFRPHGIVGPNCAKDDGRHGLGQACPECAAARDRFVGKVRAADDCSTAQRLPGRKATTHCTTTAGDGRRGSCKGGPRQQRQPAAELEPEWSPIRGGRIQSRPQLVRTRCRLLPTATSWNWRSTLAVPSPSASPTQYAGSGGTAAVQR